MKYGLENSIVEMIFNVVSSFSEIDEVILYGSRAKGNFKNGSDIDLALKGNINLFTLNNIHLKLDELMLPHIFDLTNYNQINNRSLLDHIDRVGIRIYTKQPQKQNAFLKDSPPSP